MPDWGSLSWLERLGWIALVLIIIAGLIYIAYILHKPLWKYRMKHELEQAIEKPERIKVMSYNKDKSLNYWEGGRRG